MDELLTIQDCSVILQVQPYQVRDYIRRGWLKAHKLGASETDKTSKRWRIWKADLESFINKSSNIKE